MDDFRAPKSKKLPEANSVTAWWPYTGPPYRQQVAMSAMPGPGKPFSDAQGPVGMPPMMPPMVGVYPPAGVSPVQGNRTPASPHARVGKSPRQPPPPLPMGMPPQGPMPDQQQPYALVYPPYGQYRFPAQPPYMPPPDQMPQGAPMMYAPMSPSLVGQMPFAPPPGPGVPYSPMPAAPYAIPPRPAASPGVGRHQEKRGPRPDGASRGAPNRSENAPDRT